MISGTRRIVWIGVVVGGLAAAASGAEDFHVRQGMPNCPYQLKPGTWINTFNKEWAYSVKPDGTDYRARLMRLASEDNCEFLDMTGPWWQYVHDSGKTYGWFRGDAVHANARGMQILARILEKYFAP